jgi:Ca2+-binding EF-hand superfamily protein
MYACSVHAALLTCGLYARFDQDGSGALNAQEMSLLIKAYKAEMDGVSRSEKCIQREVDSMMGKYDADGSGTLEFDEFVAMCFENQPQLKLAF